jgi:hypothetical protein
MSMGPHVFALEETPSQKRASKKGCLVPKVTFSCQAARCRLCARNASCLICTRCGGSPSTAVQAWPDTHNVQKCQGHARQLLGKPATCATVRGLALVCKSCMRSLASVHDGNPPTPHDAQPLMIRAWHQTQQQTLQRARMRETTTLQARYCRRLLPQAQA